jgi:hypothetical protein
MSSGHQALSIAPLLDANFDRSPITIVDLTACVVTKAPSRFRIAACKRSEAEPSQSWSD